MTDGPVFKEIIAIIRPERWSATKARLERFPVVYSQQRVLGRVRERGLCYLPRNGARPVGIRYLPHRMICCEVEDVMVDAVLQAILQVNGTGSPGGGRVFVLPVAAVFPISDDSPTIPALIPTTETIVYAARP